MADEKGKEKDLGIDEIKSDELEEVSGGNCSCCSNCSSCAEPPAPVQPALNQA